MFRSLELVAMVDSTMDERLDETRSFFARTMAADTMGVFGKSVRLLSNGRSSTVKHN
jgi:hypothetical protein